MAAPQGPDDPSSVGEPARDGGPEEAASYIAEQVGGLVQLARRYNLDTLGFLLDMAKMEAEEIVRERRK